MINLIMKILINIVYI